MDGNLDSWTTYMGSEEPATNNSDPVYVTTPTTNYSDPMYGTTTNFSDPVYGTTLPTNSSDPAYWTVSTTSVNRSEWHPQEDIPSSSEPYTFAHDSDVLRPLEGLSNVESRHGESTLTDVKVSLQSCHGVPTLTEENISLRNHQNIPLSGTSLNIEGFAHWTNVDKCILSAVALSEIGGNSTQEISMAKADFQQTNNGERNSTPGPRRHPQTAVLIMRNWFEDHLSNPYPNDREILRLSNSTGLKSKQIDTWFHNEREKYRKKGINNIGVKLKAKNGHPDSAVQVLNEWVDDHLGDINPSTEVKRCLADKAKLTLQQVSDWFGNYRKRKLQLQPQKKDQKELMEVGQEGQLCISDYELDLGETAELQDPFELVCQPEQNQDPLTDWDSGDEEF